MQRTTIKRYCLALILASALPLVACSDDDETPTSPTQPGPPVADTPTPPPTSEPTPTPTPPSDDRPIVSITGFVVNLVRSGANDLDVQFRIDDRTIARAKAGTPVVSGLQTGKTDFIRDGQTVTVEGRRDNGFLDVTRVTIVSDAP